MLTKREFELLDLIALLSLYYQMDSNAQLRTQSTNDDILREIKEFASKLIEQNDEIIQLLKGEHNDPKESV